MSLSFPAHTETAPAHSCEACGGQCSTIYQATDPQTGDRFGIDVCAACGLGRTCPVPEDLGRYYGSSYYGDRHGLSANYCIWRRRRWLARLTRQPGRLLDVGCGDGSFLTEIVRRGWQGVGVEIGAAARDDAHQAGLEVWPELSDLPAAVKFDVITLWHSLEHFAQPAALLGVLASKLTSGGSIVIAVPDFGGAQARCFRQMWFHLDVPRHLHHFTQSSMRETLRGAGLRPTRWGHQELEYDLFGWIQSSLNVLMPTRNALFSSVTGKAHAAGLPEIAASYALAGLLFPVAVVATALSTLTRRGGTLLVAARRAVTEGSAS